MMVLTQRSSTLRSLNLIDLMWWTLLHPSSLDIAAEKDEKILQLVEKYEVPGKVFSLCLTQAGWEELEKLPLFEWKNFLKFHTINGLPVNCNTEMRDD